MSDETQAQQPALPPRTHSEFEPAREEPRAAPPIEGEIPRPGGSTPGASGPKKAPRKRSPAATKATADKEEGKPRPNPTRPAPARGKRVELQENENRTDHSAEVLENSIEGAAVREIGDVDLRIATAAAKTEPVPAVSATRIEARKGLFSSVGQAAQGLQTWLFNWRKARTSALGERTEIPAKSGASASAPDRGSAGDDISNVVPEAVARRFLKVDHDYYFLNRTLAFSDRGNKLATRWVHPEVVRSLVEIAQARRWDTIIVKGTAQFRRSAWLEAVQQGMTVIGYQPTPVDLAELARIPSKNSVERSLEREKAYSMARQGEEAVQGASGLSKTAQTQKVTQTATSEEMTSPSSMADPELVKKARAFEKNKPSFVVKKYPDLAWAYGIVEAAKTFAAERLPESAREGFAQIARQHVLQKIVSGEEVKGPMVYVESSKTSEKGRQTKTSGAGARDTEKARRLPEKMQER